MNGRRDEWFIGLYMIYGKYSTTDQLNDNWIRGKRKVGLLNSFYVDDRLLRENDLF